MIRITQIILALLGIWGGFVGGSALNILLSPIVPNYVSGKMQLAFVVVVCIVCGLIGFLLGKPLAKGIIKLTDWLESRLQKMPVQDLLGGAIGLIIGLIIATFIGYALEKIPLGGYFAIIVSLLLGYVGAVVGVRKHAEMLNLPTIIKRERARLVRPKGTCPESEDGTPCTKPKILDTSVIIDGRIADICQTGFVDGPLVIPNFVLEELRHIADSSDALKRIRGRRGLDILNKIRRELTIEVQISNEDFPDINEVDDKLVRLAQDMCGCVITNDFNLNKVAELKGVTVLNINELANAIKPVVLPGEEMIVTVVKEGKELNQGVAYLDDGTMIVVENGRNYMNETIHVAVTSVIQTNAGRMIFARPND